MPVSGHPVSRPGRHRPDQMGLMRWKPAINAFAITSGGRFPAAGTCSPTAGNTVSEMDAHLGGQVTKYTSDSSNFGADGPFFRIIREGLEGLVDGEDYFDLLTDDVVFEYVISVPGITVAVFRSVTALQLSVAQW